MNIPLPRPEFPTSEPLARSFLEEGIRHLEDARVLHQAQRYPATIASALKAAEFGVKAVIILDGAMGWWDGIFATHTPLSNIDNPQKPFFQHHITIINNFNNRGTLVRDVKEMEKLVPTKPRGPYDIESQKNPEYPFLSYEPNSGMFALVKPSIHFGEADSKKYYNTAQNLLTAVVAQYIIIGGWDSAIPEAL
jgi:hypothetical protein